MHIGGLVGCNEQHSIIANSCSSGTVTGNNSTGGLVGVNYLNAKIENCTSTSSVTVTGGGSDVGGLVGRNTDESKVINSSSSGSVTAENGNRVGGLVGNNVNISAINNCYSSGTVSGNSNVGGLVGYIWANDTDNNCIISNCYTTAKVTGTTGVGAFLGAKGTISSILLDNEYNSTVNNGMRAVGFGLNDPTEEQIVDNTDLHIDPVVADPSIGSKLPKVAFGVGVDTTSNLQVGINSDSNSVISVDTGLAFGEFNIDITTEGNARTALATIDRLMGKMTDKQTELGAISARLDSAMQYQSIQKTAKIATNSLIKDADFAAESSNYIKQQILQQTTSSLLSTANQNPNIALMLLNTHRAA